MTLRCRQSEGIERYVLGIRLMVVNGDYIQSCHSKTLLSGFLEVSSLPFHSFDLCFFFLVSEGGRGDVFEQIVSGGGTYGGGKHLGD